MPLAAAHARKLLACGYAHMLPHHAFTLLQLTKEVESPSLRPVVLFFSIERQQTSMLLIALGRHGLLPLLHLLVDMRSDLSLRLRRRKGHRRRRRSCTRYRAMWRHDLPFKLHRPSQLRAGQVLHKRRETLAVRRGGLQRISATIRWRSQLIERVIATLQTLVPVSHLIIQQPLNNCLPPIHAVSAAGDYLSQTLSAHSQH